MEDFLKNILENFPIDFIRKSLKKFLKEIPREFLEKDLKGLTFRRIPEGTPGKSTEGRAERIPKGTAERTPQGISFKDLKGFLEEFTNGFLGFFPGTPGGILGEIPGIRKKSKEEFSEESTKTNRTNYSSLNP